MPPCPLVGEGNNVLPAWRTSKCRVHAVLALLACVRPPLGSHRSCPVRTLLDATHPGRVGSPFGALGFGSSKSACVVSSVRRCAATLADESAGLQVRVAVGLHAPVAVAREAERVAW